MEVHRKDGEIENRPVSKGGKLFDLLTYGGIAGVGTFFATIKLANMFKPGAKLNGVEQWLRKSIQKIGAGKKLADEATDVTNLMWGGNLMLIPVGIMEHFRTPIVKAFNRLLNDPTDPKSIEEAPPQTLGSILKARCVAWLTVFAGFAGTKKVMGKDNYDAMLDKAGNKWADLRGKTPGTQEHREAYDFGHTGALDVLATVSSATMLYVTSHFFAKRTYERRVEKDYIEKKKQQTRAPIATAEAPALLPTPTPSDKPMTQITHAQHEHALLAEPQQPQLHA